MTTKPAIIIDETPATEDVRAERCDRCKCSHFPKTEDMGECRAKPPTHFIFLLPARNLANQQTLQGMGQSGWPAIRRNQWCGEFRAKVTH